MARSLPQIGVRLAFSRRYRNRYRQITSALIRHGFGFLITQLGLTNFLPFKISIFGHPEPQGAYTQPERVRLIFEELGTTFIKLGQVLSTRIDLLPPEYIRELEKLLDQVPPVSFELIRLEIEKELGKPLENIFYCIDPIPLASASIGQVHAAVLNSGENVIVKVKRPGIDEIVAVDTHILNELAALANRRLPWAENYDFEGIAREFMQTLLRELDYVLEARNADRFRSNFRRDERVFIPKVYWDYTTQAVIVMERVAGLRINDKHGLTAAGLNPSDIAKTSADILLKQIFEHGFFHADPHPANFFVVRDGVIGIIDFGMVGYIDPETKSDMIDLFIAVYEQNPDSIIDAYLELGVIGRVQTLGELRSDISTLMTQYYGLSLNEININTILYDATSLVRRHGLRLPPNLALLAKTVAMEEALVLQLDPSFNFAEATRPFARKLWEQTYSPQALARRAVRALVEISNVSTRAPRQIRRILGQASRGELQISANQPRLDEELAVLSAIVNRLIAGILGAAFIVFGGFMLTIYYAVRTRVSTKRDSDAS